MAKPALIRVVTLHETQAGPRWNGWAATVASDVWPNWIRGVSYACATREEAIAKAIADARSTRRQCTCTTEHLTLEACRRAKRAAKAESRPKLRAVRA